MCQNLIVSSFVAAEVSPTIMLPVNLYKFSVRSPLRIVIEPLVTLIPPSIPENLYPRASKAPNERRVFFIQNVLNVREGLNLFIKHPHTDVADTNSFIHDIISH